MVIKANEILYRTLDKDGNASDIQSYFSTKRVKRAIKDVLANDSSAGIFHTRKVALTITDEAINNLFHDQKDNLEEV